MSVMLKLRSVLNRLAEIAGKMAPRQYPEGLPALCLDGLNNMPLEQQPPSASLSELMGPILYAVQRNRRSIERRLTRKNVIPLKRTAIPKTNIVTCLHCGNPHEIQTICGHCYETVRKETEKLKKSMDKDEFFHNYPQKEVSFVYKNDDKENQVYEKCHLVEVKGNRPAWFPNVLMKKVKNEK